MRKYIIQKSEEGQTLEKYIQKLLKSAPNSFIYKLFRKKDVKVNGHHEDRKFVISENDEVSVYVKEEQFEDFLKEKTYQNNINSNIKYSKKYHEYLKSTENFIDGWNLYNPILEYERQGISENNNLITLPDGCSLCKNCIGELIIKSTDSKIRTKTELLKMTRKVRQKHENT